jgi:hypothetical protein
MHVLPKNNLRVLEKDLVWGGGVIILLWINVWILNYKFRVDGLNVNVEF